MKKALETSRYMVLLAVGASLAASLATFLWGVYTTFGVLVVLIGSRGKDSGIAVEMLELMDKFLIAVGLYIFAIGLYELFIRDDLELPDWLEVHNLHDIKVRLSSIAVLVMVIAFAERVVQWRTAQDALYFGLAIAAVTIALVVFNYVGARE
jgi:uncharacterized membrane protein YqhA